MPPRSSPVTAEWSTTPQPRSPKKSSRNIGSALHAFAKQTSPFMHGAAQPPQFASSKKGFTHSEPQASGASGGQTQAAASHRATAGHVAPQPPQLARSLCGSTQAPSQEMSP